MNVFRILGDLCHILAILVLLWRIWTTKSVAGLSGKSQLLYALVFTLRYLDLFLYYISLYNTAMKILYVACTYFTVYLIYVKFKATYNKQDDSFMILFLVAPCCLLALFVNYAFTSFEVCWAFSIYLESVAVLPQLYMITNRNNAETITTHYLFLLGIYRLLYIFNWVYRYHSENTFDKISIVAGCVQTFFYLDFFYLYVTKVMRRQELILPV